MRKAVPLIFICMFLTLIQVSFLAKLLSPFFNPSLIIALAFSFFFVDREDLAFMTGFVGGIILDLLSFTIVGTSPLVIIATLLVYKLVKQYVFRGWATNILFVIVAQVLYLSVISGFSMPNGALIYSSLTTLIFSVLFFFVLERVLSYFKKSGYDY